VEFTMIGIFCATPVTESEARLAFSLARLADPNISAAQWNAYTRRIFAGRRKGGCGLLGIRDARGIFHGLFAYAVERTWHRPRRLRITDVFMARMPGLHAEDALICCAESIAQTTHCQEIVIEIAADSRGGTDIPIAEMCARRFRPVAVSYARQVGGMDSA
jgi:hypothetical protein